MADYDEKKPPRYRTRIDQAPKLRDLYWCDFPDDAHLPEMWKCRPVIVIAADRTLSGTVLVVPTSSLPQPGNRWAHELANTIDDTGPSFAICDKPTTMAVSRLTIQIGHRRPRRISQADFTAVVTLVLQRMPKLHPV